MRTLSPCFTKIVLQNTVHAAFRSFLSSKVNLLTAYWSKFQEDNNSSKEHAMKATMQGGLIEALGEGERA